MYKKLVKTIIKKRKELKQNVKKYWKTIYCNIILIELTLKRYIRAKDIKANLGKRILNYNIVNIIGGKYLGALRRLNKSKKYNSNTFKNRNNKSKKLALLGCCPSK